MGQKLDVEGRMTVKTLHGCGVTNAETARLLGVSEGTVRYHLRRQTVGMSDGRARQVQRAAAYRAAMDGWRARA
jgi:IS30 family transposase